jgi:hypothetical protein
LLLLDIDGVLNPFAAKSCPPAMSPTAGGVGRRGLRPEHGQALLALAERWFSGTCLDPANTFDR